MNTHTSKNANANSPHPRPTMVVLDYNKPSHRKISGWLYIGRQNHNLAASPLANPFKKGDRMPDGTIAETTADTLPYYKKWLWTKMLDADSAVLAALHEAYNIRKLMCWSDYPNESHAPIVARAADWLAETPQPNRPKRKKHTREPKAKSPYVETSKLAEPTKATAGTLDSATVPNTKAGRKQGKPQTMKSITITAEELTRFEVFYALRTLEIKHGTGSTRRFLVQAMQSINGQKTRTRKQISPQNIVINALCRLHKGGYFNDSSDLDAIADTTIRQLTELFPSAKPKKGKHTESAYNPKTASKRTRKAEAERQEKRARTQLQEATYKASLAAHAKPSA